MDCQISDAMFMGQEIMRRHPCDAPHGFETTEHKIGLAVGDMPKSTNSVEPKYLQTPTSMSLLVLSGSDVEQITSKLTPSELQILMARVFRSLSSPIQSPPTKFTPLRTSIPTMNHTTLFMPARMSEKPIIGTTVKVASVPRNPGDTGGLPASTLVLDEASGAVKAIVNARSLTALRNAAGMHNIISTTGLLKKAIH
jgi:hypothetical protein